MNYWNKYSKFNSKIADVYQQMTKDKLIVIDGGAAGGLSEPFKSVNKIITAIRFEPRGESEIELRDSDIHIDGGLWSNDCLMELHIGNEPTTSSICPPNIKFLEQFEDQYGVSARKTVGKIQVPLRSVDSCVNENAIPLPNFIKLDIHSAELPALKGSINSLSNCVGLLIETWNSEVHVGQGLHYEVEKFAIENGFEVYDSICAARWKIKHNEGVCDIDRGRYIGSEILFIKKNVSSNLKLKKSMVLCLFGFYNEAKNQLKTTDCEVDKIIYMAIDEVQRNIRKSPRHIFTSFILKILSIIR